MWVNDMWLNLVRVWRLAERLLCHDLGDRIFGIDEKPLHFNESGSKSVRTLKIQGSPAVRFKENHTATRDRCSIMTSVSSDRTDAARPAKPAHRVDVQGQVGQADRQSDRTAGPEDVRGVVGEGQLPQ